MNKELLLTIIREHNLTLTESSIQRLIELAEVTANWDGRDAEPMDENSCREMCHFLSTVKEPIPSDIGFFFNHEGMMSINWMLGERLVDVCFEPEATYIYMTGYDDGIALPRSVFKHFKYTAPESCFISYKTKLEMVSGMLYKLKQDTAKNLVEVIAYDYGWGEHGDELEMNTDALHSFVHFIDNLEVLPEKVIIFLTHEGFLEVVLMDYDPRHEIEFTPEGLLFFLAPEYDMTEVNKNNFNQYKDINDFLTGETK
jgi:hypothetical protein